MNQVLFKYTLKKVKHPPIKISNFLLYESPSYVILIWMVLQRFVNKMILFPLTIIMSLEPNRMHVKLQNHNFRKIQYLHVLLHVLQF